MEIEKIMADFYADQPKCDWCGADMNHLQIGREMLRTWKCGSWEFDERDKNGEFVKKDRENIAVKRSQECANSTVAALKAENAALRKCVAARILDAARKEPPC